MTNQVIRDQTTGSRWKTLYKVGGAAALIAVVFFRRNIGAEITLFGITAPSSADGWFTLLQHNLWLGLGLLDFFDIVNYALVGLILLALYGALRQVDTSSMVIATASGLVGIAVYFASNQTFSMLALSNQYASSTSETYKATLLAAGEALLATYHESTGIYMGLFLVLLAGLIISIVMLRSNVFSKATAYMGILANVFGLGYFVALIFAPTITFLPPTISAPFRLIWYVLIARRFFQLGAGGSQND